MTPEELKRLKACSQEIAEILYRHRTEHELTGHRQAREGRNPQTGNKVQIPVTKVPAFSAGKLFKEKVSSSK